MKTASADHEWMSIALEQARQAFHENEVPVGAVLVKDNSLLFAAHNLTNSQSNPLAHAEKLVIEKACQAGYKFLQDFTIYVTVEPCLMCAGIIILARVGRVVYGCTDPKAGAAGSVYNALLDRNFNHNPQLETGIMATECSNLIQQFFAGKRITPNQK